MKHCCLNAFVIPTKVTLVRPTITWPHSWSTASLCFVFPSDLASQIFTSSTPPASPANTLGVIITGPSEIGLPPDTSANVVVLEDPVTGYRAYVIGSAHVSSQSGTDIVRVMEAVQPQYVAVEVGGMLHVCVCACVRASACACACGLPAHACEFSVCRMK